MLKGKAYCANCVESFVTAEPKAAAKREAATSTQSRGDQLPPEIRGWNWGAFFMSWLWGIFNKVWISLIVLVLPVIWNFVLGAKGNEWAWRNKSWDSVEHFKRTQRTWAIVGLILFLLGLAIWAIYVIVFVVIMGGAFAGMGGGW